MSKQGVLRVLVLGEIVVTIITLITVDTTKTCKRRCTEVKLFFHDESTRVL